MPIEIKELHIRVAVTSPESGPTSMGKTATRVNGGIGDDRETIVSECVEEVMQILQNKTQR